MKYENHQPQLKRTETDCAVPEDCRRDNLESTWLYLDFSEFGIMFLMWALKECRNREH